MPSARLQALAKGTKTSSQFSEGFSSDFILLWEISWSGCPAEADEHRISGAYPFDSASRRQSFSMAEGSKSLIVQTRSVKDPARIFRMTYVF